MSNSSLIRNRPLAVLPIRKPALPVGVNRWQLNELRGLIWNLNSTDLSVTVYTGPVSRYRRTKKNPLLTPRWLDRMLLHSRRAFACPSLLCIAHVRCGAFAQSLEGVQERFHKKLSSWKGLNLCLFRWCVLEDFSLFSSYAYSVATLLGKVLFGPWLVGCSVDRCCCFCIMAVGRNACSFI
jgi:hypothetical protein